MAKEVSISYFKAHCLELIKKLQNKDETIIITNRHKPVAKIQSFEESGKISLFGLFKDRVQIKGNIIDPVDEKWSAE